MLQRVVQVPSREQVAQKLVRSCLCLHESHFLNKGAVFRVDGKESVDMERFIR